MMATRAQIEAGLKPAPPSLEQLELLVQFARNRDSKADLKLSAAEREKSEASAGLAAAIAARDHFIANDPSRLL